MESRIRNAFGSGQAREMVDAAGLPPDYRRALIEHVAPLAAWLAATAREAGRPLLIGINGCQGAGKTTLSRFLVWVLDQVAGLHCPMLSIDDLYLTRAQRDALAETVHPLLRTRGVPGTHDLDRGHGLFDQLLDPGRTRPIPIPVFDKAADDRLPPEAWTIWKGPVDLVLFDGWCVSCPPQPESALAEPVNELERTEDRDGRWRRYVNGQLKGPYRTFFARLDRLVMLQAPSFDCVYRWRGQQERELSAARSGAGVMDEAGLQRFIQHYQRLTRHMLKVLPARADRVLKLDADHRIVALRGGR